jgi:BarA-like signal transduction histidine kinase
MHHLPQLTSNLQNKRMGYIQQNQKAEDIISKILTHDQLTCSGSTAMEDLMSVEHYNHPSKHPKGTCSKSS